MERESGMKETPVACHGTWLGFLNALLAYLRDVESEEEQQREDLAKIESLAQELKGVLPEPHKFEGINVESQIDRVLQLAREYYPSEGDSPELGEAIAELNKTVQDHYGIS